MAVSLGQYPRWAPRVGSLGGVRFGNGNYRSIVRPPRFVGYNFDGFTFDSGLVGTKFIRCSMVGSKLFGDLQMLSIEKCDLTEATIAGDISGTEITGGSLRHADLSSLTAKDREISNPIFRDVDVTGAVMALRKAAYLRGNITGHETIVWLRSFGRVAKPEQIAKAFSLEDPTRAQSL